MHARPGLNRISGATSAPRRTAMVILLAVMWSLSLGVEGSAQGQRRTPAPPTQTAQAARAQRPARPRPRPRAPVGRTVSGRDPFKFPVIGPGGGAAGKRGPGKALLRVPGKRGLLIGSLILEGIVVTENEMIAVVDDFRNRAFFLRENDVLYNVVVSSISWDTVVFKENVLDREGRVSTREVVKRMIQEPGEG